VIPFRVQSAKYDVDTIVEVVEAACKRSALDMLGENYRERFESVNAHFVSLIQAD